MLVLLVAAGVEEFVSCLSAEDQEQMVAPQRHGIHESQDAIEEHCKRYTILIDGTRPGRVIMATPRSHMTNAGSEKVDSKKGSRSYKEEEIAVVASADTIIQPDTVVILCFDTVVTYAAVVTSRWSPDVTALTVLGRNLKETVRL